MADEFKLEIDDAAVLKALAALPGSQTSAVLRRTLNAVGAEHTRWMVLRRFTGYSGKARARSMQVRTGRLRRAVRHSVKGRKIGDLALRMFVAAPYARIHEEGGTIRPRRKRALTVPTPAALTASGALKGGARIRPSGGGYTTDLGDTFLFRTKKGGMAIGIKSRRTGKPLVVRGTKSPRAFYVLKRSVRIPPRLGFRAEYMAHTRRFALRELRMAGDEIVRNAANEGGNA